MSNVKKYDLTTLYFPGRMMNKLDFLKIYPMSIIEAPSGFGKTTAVRAFFRQHVDKNIPVYWHTFWGESFSSSWKSLCEQFAKIDKESADRLLELSMLDEDNWPIITEILENIECVKESYLVLDNFQDTKIPFPIHLLKAFAKHGGEKLHVVIITQQLSAGGMLTAGQSHRIYQVNAQDLAFTKSDAENYYKQAGLRLTPEQLESVHRRSDGWIAALYLQMLAYVQTGNFETGDMEKLMYTTIWSKLTDNEKNILLTMSIFQSFTLPQSEFITEISSEQTQSLLRNNPFIRFDQETRQYHMHSILRSYLLDMFEDQSETHKKTIYMRSGDWFSKNRAYIHAMRFYHMIDAYEKILALPLTSLDVADNSVGEDIRPIIFDLIDKTDYDIQRLYPQSMINVAFALFFLGEHERLFMMRKKIDKIIDGSALSEKQKNVLRGEMELLMSFLEYNKIDKMSEKHRHALALIGGSTTLISNKSTWTFGSPSVLYMYYRKSGELEKELEQMDECMPYYYQLANGHGSGAEIVMRAEAEFNKGNLDAAETLCHKTLFVADSKKQNSIYQCSMFLLARIAIMRGDSMALHTALQSLQERAKLNQENLCQHTIDLCQGFLHITLGEAKNLPLWLSRGEISQKYISMMVVSFAHIIYGRALLERKEYLKLMGASEYFMEISSIFPNLLPQIYMGIYLAQTNEAIGNHSKAVRLLTEVLQTALPDKLYMPFVENGEGIKKLLPEAAEYITDKEGIAKINELYHNFCRAAEKIKADRPSLSAREQEVFELIAEGLTNKKIAERLFISVSTVKTLVSRILEKTETSSRTQLVAQISSNIVNK